MTAPCVRFEQLVLSIAATRGGRQWWSQIYGAMGTDVGEHINSRINQPGNAVPPWTELMLHFKWGTGRSKMTVEPPHRNCPDKNAVAGVGSTPRMKGLSGKVDLSEAASTRHEGFGMARAGKTRRTHQFPRPRINLTRYHGVFAPNSPLRCAIVPGASRPRPTRKPKIPTADSQQTPDDPAISTEPPTAPLTWVQRLKRVFKFDIASCPLCSGQLRCHRRCHRPGSHPQNPRPRPAACATKSASKAHPVSPSPACPTGLPTAEPPATAKLAPVNPALPVSLPIPARQPPGHVQEMLEPANHASPSCFLKLPYRARLYPHTFRKTPVIRPIPSAP